MNHEDAKRHVIEAIQSDQSLSRFEKRRFSRIMRSPFRGHVQQAVTDHVMSMMLSAGVLAVTPEGVEQTVDLEQLIAFIKELLPVILQIISIFGG